MSDVGHFWAVKASSRVAMATCDDVTASPTAEAGQTTLP